MLKEIKDFFTSGMMAQKKGVEVVVALPLP
jgi:hypothetical protein